ncbi:MAG: RNA-binding protein [Cenarchaeum sp. SB0664_bin_35]|nr:RNA-binding protein [Cenarchaeum sp. SB0664_bin_35]
MSERRKNVIPGDVITTATYRNDQNTILDGRLIISTAVGVSEISDGVVRVIPLTGMYMPRIDDMIVGKVVTHTSLSWELDINSCYVGFLPATDVFGRDFSARSDELNTRLKKGDLVAARIANSDRSRDPLLTIVDRDLGKIDSGELIEIPSSKIPRLIGKRGTMIQMIESQTGSMITVGQNGWVVVHNEDYNGLIKAKKAIRMVEKMAHLHNLTDKIRKMLEAEK